MARNIAVTRIPWIVHVVPVVIVGISAPVGIVGVVI
jgi:hypothetical protein